MNKKIKKALLNIVAYYSRLAMRFRNEYKYVIILSHMRSGSSLLIHLLASNPDVLCYGESHISYDNKKALAYLIAKNLIYRRKFLPSGIFIADKILHSKFKLDLLKKIPSDNLKIIFLLYLKKWKIVLCGNFMI